MRIPITHDVTERENAMSGKAKPVVSEPEVDTELLTTAPDDWEFETVSDESPTRVIFDTPGDTFIGQYQGIEHIEQPPDDRGVDQSFDLHTFRGRDGSLYAVNDSYKMKTAMADIKPDTWVRLTYVKDIPSNKGNPMKDIKVEARK
jgi:hypothetical protein